jgi:hypothetical protein
MLADASNAAAHQLQHILPKQQHQQQQAKQEA